MDKRYKNVRTLAKKKSKKLSDKQIAQATFKLIARMESRDARLAKLLRSVADILDEA